MKLPTYCPDTPNDMGAGISKAVAANIESDRARFQIAAAALMYQSGMIEKAKRDAKYRFSDSFAEFAAKMKDWLIQFESQDVDDMRARAALVAYQNEPAWREKLRPVLNASHKRYQDAALKINASESARRGAAA